MLARGLAANRAAIREIGIEAAETQHLAIARRRANHTFTETYLGADAALAVAATGKRHELSARFVVQQHARVPEREIFLERFERGVQQRLEIARAIDALGHPLQPAHFGAVPRERRRLRWNLGPARDEKSFHLLERHHFEHVG